MTFTYPAYCRKCELESSGKISLPGHRRKHWWSLKTECQRCHTVKSTPVIRWAGGLLFFAFMFSIVFYILYASLSVLWPLIEMLFTDPDTQPVTFAFLMVPGYYVCAWIIGKTIK